MVKSIYWYEHWSNKKSKNDFEKDFLKLMSILEKLWKLWEKRDIKLVATQRRRDYVVSEQNYHTTKLFTKNVLAKEMKKTEIIISRPVSLGLSILHLNIILKYVFWYDYVKPKMVKK